MLSSRTMTNQKFFLQSCQQQWSIFLIFDLIFQIPIILDIEFQQCHQLLLMLDATKSLCLIQLHCQRHVSMHFNLYIMSRHRVLLNFIVLLDIQSFLILWYCILAVYGSVTMSFAFEHNLPLQQQ